jgi:hypothetical protein
MYLFNYFVAHSISRGISWSIGGDADVSSVVTMPNILKKFSPNLIGFSTGVGDEKSANSKLNVAVSGAIGNVQLLHINTSNIFLEYAWTSQRLGCEDEIFHFLQLHK